MKDNWKLIGLAIVITLGVTACEYAKNEETSITQVPPTGAEGGGSVQPPVCGDNKLDAGEECEDRNTVSGDGCSSTCQDEDSAAVCGNGIIETGETCDDRNTNNGDGCSSTCQTETTGGGTSAPPPACGNGILETGENCEDGNTVSGDGCSSICQTEIALCGNGAKEGTEACDDGNTVNGDGCDVGCLASKCGNGILAPGEQCDDGNVADGDGCQSNCTIPGCKNGIREGAEECDDGNTANGDGCDINCTASRCGNHVVGGGETCDDGNTLSFDGCAKDCKVEKSFQFAYISLRDGGIQNLFKGVTGANSVQKITNNTGGASSFSAPAFRHDGAKIAFGNILLSLIPVISVWDQNSGLATVLADIPSFAPSWSPSGDKIYFLSLDEGGKLGKLMVANADGSSPGVAAVMPLDTIFDTVVCSAVRDSDTGNPARRKLIFSAKKPGETYDLFLRDMTALLEVKKINIASVSYADDVDPSLSPDGRFLVWVRKYPYGAQIMKCELDYGLSTCKNNTSSLLTNTSGFDNVRPSVCGDGSILFESNRDGNREIYRMKGDGSEQTNISKNVAEDKDPVCGPAYEFDLFAPFTSVIKKTF